MVSVLQHPDHRPPICATVYLGVIIDLYLLWWPTNTKNYENEKLTACVFKLFFDQCFAAAQKASHKLEQTVFCCLMSGLS